MSVTITTVPSVPVAGQEVRLVGVASTGTDEATRWALTSVPAKSALPLGLIVERPPVAARTDSVLLTYVAAVTTSQGTKPAAITRATGSFVADGYLPGMVADISGTVSNNKRVAVTAVAAGKLTLDATYTLTSETVTSSLRGALEGGSNPIDTFTPDVAGEYGVAAYEYFYAPAVGSYDGDPLSVAQYRLLSTSTTTVNVGTALDLPINPVSGHSTTLRIIVIGDTVRAAALVNPATELARMAALDATVAAAVAAMVGVAVNSLDADFITDVTTIGAAYEAHRILVTGSVHYSSDTTNALLREQAYSIPTAIQRLNDIAAKLIGHTQATSAGGTWHGFDDNLNTLQVAPSASSLAEAIVLKADLRERLYERHRGQTSAPAVHGLADNTNTIAAPATLPAAIVAYLDYVADNTPDIPAGEAEGVSDAQAAWGFRPS